MVFTRKLLIVLISVWLLVNAISVASGTTAAHFQVPKETVESIDQNQAHTLPPHVRLTEGSKEHLRRFANASKFTGLAVDLVRDQIHHLHSGNFEEALKDWHPEGQVFHNPDQFLTRKENTVLWPDDQPFHRSASQYISLLEKYRRDGQPNMRRPLKTEGPWAHSFSGLAVTVLDVHANGVLISVDEPGVIDLGEPTSLENPAPLGAIFGYRSIHFTVQVGSVFEQYEEIGPDTDYSDVEFRVRLQHLSLSPAPGC